MKILALEKDVDGILPGDFGPYLKAEARKVWELQQAGVIREIYFRQEVSSAVLVLECADKEAAIEVLASLPLVQAGLTRFDVIPLRPYPGLKRLFTGD
jgi:hypothetical protein